MILWKFFPKRNLFSFFYIITESITHINFYYNNWDFISIFIKKKNIHCFQQWYENSPKSYPPRYHHQLDPNNKSVETRIQRVRHQWISPILPRYLPSSFAILLFARRKYGRESIISMQLASSNYSSNTRGDSPAMMLSPRAKYDGVANICSPETLPRTRSFVFQPSLERA